MPTNMSKKWTVLFTDKYKNVNHPMIEVCVQAIFMNCRAISTLTPQD